MATTISNPSKILRLKQVKDATGLSRSHLYNMVKTGEFPKPIKLGKRASGWLQSEVQDFIQVRVNESRAVKGDAK